MTPSKLALALALACLSHPAVAQQFDRTLLGGQWAESVDNKYACVPENLHTRFVLSADGKTLTFKLDRKWRIATGREVDEYAATVVRAEARTLIIRYGPEVGSMSADMAEWEVRFIGPGTYRWRSISWPEGRYNAVIGVRCS